MTHRLKLLDGVRTILSERFFTPEQIEKVIPRLHDQLIKEPKYLGEIIDTWNTIMSQSGPNKMYNNDDVSCIPPLAHPSRSSLMGKLQINMNHILADVEPDLLLFDPKKLIQRNNRLQGLGIAKNLGEHWLLLYNAPRGTYLQDWQELVKKVYYLEDRVIDFLYDKREQRSMLVHPLVKNAAVVEVDFDHIRTRYLFASRSGYKALAHMFSVQTALDKPTLKDLIVSDNEVYLSQFAPFCSMEEYKSFSNLIKKNYCDEDDAIIFEKLAELNSL